MSDETGAEEAELRLLLSVRDRLHLAEVLRALKRSQPVLHVQRDKPRMDGGISRSPFRPTATPGSGRPGP
jgi:GTP pyrophosphokinase/guanosine-3',5'-bis(diphosphate) 3'-pyrophosphohydrolase